MGSIRTPYLCPPSHQCSIDHRVRRVYLGYVDRLEHHQTLLFGLGRGRSGQSRTRPEAADLLLACRCCTRSCMHLTEL